MTGHGEAHRHEEGLSIAVEIRTVNNRYFKLNLRMTEGYIPLDRTSKPLSASTSAAARCR
jgi:uncharacterized protein YicC (UPF0701 family)